MGYPITCVHVPKTVDNDLPITDCCPGFGSVAKYVATSMREASFDVASMAKTSTKVFVLEVMGRHAGWITAACGLAAETPSDGPHMLLFPEITFEQDRFIAQASKPTVKKYGYCVIGVSEGLQGPDGKFMSESGLRDAFGHAQLGGVAPVIANLVREKLKLQISLGSRGLSAARGAPHRLENRCAAGLCRRQGRRRDGAEGHERGDADHRAQIRQAVQMDASVRPS